MPEIHYATMVLDVKIDPSMPPERISPDLENCTLTAHYVKLEHAALGCLRKILEHREETGEFLAMAIVACEGNRVRLLNRKEDAMLSEIRQQTMDSYISQKATCEILGKDGDFYSLDR